MRLIASLLTVLLALPALALDLGPLVINSDFGHPLQASVRVKDSANARARNLDVQFYDYRRADRPLRPDQVLVLSRLRYEVLRQRSGEDLRIRLYTNEPLEEARIGFRLRVRDRRERTEARRGYLHILPGTSVKRSDGATRDRRRDRRTLMERRSSGWQLGMAAPEKNLYVSSTDYHALWVAGQQLKSGYGLSAFQAMLAIFDINRHAFGEDVRGEKNINLLWAGEELRMPTLDEMRSYDRPSSIVEVALQNYYAEAGPLCERCLAGVLRLQAPEELQIDELEPYEEADAGVDRDLPTPRRPDLEVPAEVAVPLPDDELDLDTGSGWLLYLLILGIVLLAGVLIFLWMRRRGWSIGRRQVEQDVRKQRVIEQMQQLRDYVQAKDERAQALYQSILQSAHATSEQISEAEDLMQSFASDNQNS